jgi:hypothetical protein
MNLKTFPFLFVLVFWLVSLGAKPLDTFAQEAGITFSMIEAQHHG